jgi:hypothetical protein
VYAAMQHTVPCSQSTRNRGMTFAPGSSGTAHENAQCERNLNGLGLQIPLRALAKREGLRNLRPSSFALTASLSKL